MQRRLSGPSTPGGLEEPKRPLYGLVVSRSFKLQAEEERQRGAGERPLTGWKVKVWSRRSTIPERRSVSVELFPQAWQTGGPLGSHAPGRRLRADAEGQHAENQPRQTAQDVHPLREVRQLRQTPGQQEQTGPERDLPASQPRIGFVPDHLISQRLTAPQPVQQVRADTAALQWNTQGDQQNAHKAEQHSAEKVWSHHEPL